MLRRFITLTLSIIAGVTLFIGLSLVMACTTTGATPATPSAIPQAPSPSTATVEPAHESAPGMSEASYELAGAVFNDVDGDGWWNPDAEPLELTPVSMTLYAYDPALSDVPLSDASSEPWGALLKTSLSGSGRFTFTGLSPGGYVVAVTPPAGQLASTPTRRPVRLPAGSPASGLIFGLTPVHDTAGRATGLVFDDANNDGRQTPGERGLAGVPVTVTGAALDGAPIVSVTLTFTDGSFSLPLPAGEMTLAAGMAGRIATGPAHFTRVISTHQASEVQFAQSGRPNILFILSDDQPYQTVIGDGERMTGVLETVSERVMPRTWADIFGQGLVFTDAHITTGPSRPSRASLYTGSYAHRHGVIDNGAQLTETAFMSYPNVASRLASLGYYNGLVGKYLNNYPFDEIDPNDKPDAFDYWAHRCESNSLNASARRCYEYWAAEFNLITGSVDGTSVVTAGWSLHTGYVPYFERDLALDFLTLAAGQPQPFFLLFAPLSPHSQTTFTVDYKWPDPAPDELAPALILTSEIGEHRPLSFNVVTHTSPYYLQAGPSLAGDDLALSDMLRLGTLQSLQSLDRIVYSLTQRLDALGMYTNTVVVFLSDNGYLYGEHKGVRKSKAYQESTHVPFAVRYPAVIQQPRVAPDLVANIDVAPTLLDLAGDTGVITPAMDGLSLAPLFTSTAPLSPNRALVIEGWAAEVPPVNPPFAAIRTGDYLYVENECDIAEFYPVTDTWQMTNTAVTPDDFDAQETQARARLAALGLSRGTMACARVFGGVHASLTSTVPYARPGSQVVISYGVGPSLTVRRLDAASGSYTTTSRAAYATEGFVISPNVPVTLTVRGPFGAARPEQYVFEAGFAPGSTNGPFDFDVVARRAFVPVVWK